MFISNFLLFKGLRCSSQILLLKDLISYSSQIFLFKGLRCSSQIFLLKDLSYSSQIFLFKGLRCSPPLFLRRKELKFRSQIFLSKDLRSRSYIVPLQDFGHGTVKMFNWRIWDFKLPPTKFLLFGQDKIKCFSQTMKKLGSKDSNLVHACSWQKVQKIQEVNLKILLMKILHLFGNRFPLKSLKLQKMNLIEFNWI